LKGEPILHLSLQSSMTSNLLKIVIAVASWACMSSTWATGLAQMRDFLDRTKTSKGAFTQTVKNQARRTTQTNSGTFAFARPGKFRWTYEKPFDQLIVGDGSKVWIFDRDLNQVIVRKLDVALGATPAALLAGDNAIERTFNLTEGEARDGLEFVDATPKGVESQFTHMRLGFKDGLPRTMELTDAFGQNTVLNFTAVERNPALAPDLFRFAPPAGADVVGEAN
jgi:outer membrane lipoprotein carrier protein